MMEVGQIMWDTDCNAPCCPGKIVSANGDTVLILTDWDYPGVASTFGWSPANVQDEDAEHRCDHSETDGTVDCLCGVIVSDFLGSAREYLEGIDGMIVDDPGYFSGD